MKSRIAAWLKSVEPESTLLRVWTLSGGISSTMTAFTISTDGAIRSLILRQPNAWTLANVPKAVVKEFDRLGALHSGGLPVQAPVFCDETDTHFGRPGLVIEYIDGSPDLNPENRKDYLRQFARQLAAVHCFDVSSSSLNLGPAAIRYFERYRTGKEPQVDPAFQVEQIWAQLASQASVTSRNDPGLLHGDFWPGNLLWRDGSLVAVIDWEEAEIGDPLQDLAICRLDLWWIFDREAMEFFTQSYLALNPVDISLLPLWDLRTALRPVSNLEQWATAYGPLGRPDITADHMRRIHADFVAQAFAALDSAAP